MGKAWKVGIGAVVLAIIVVVLLSYMNTDQFNISDTEDIITSPSQTNPPGTEYTIFLTETGVKPTRISHQSGTPITIVVELDGISRGFLYFTQSEELFKITEKTKINLGDLSPGSYEYGSKEVYGFIIVS